MLDRHHLKILRAISQQGSLTAAAEHLHLTQSALSHAVRKLEERSGTALWRRQGRQLCFTRSGEYLLALAERLLPQFEQAETQLAQYARGERGTLRIGMECHPCYQWLQAAIQPFLQQWPDVDVDVRQRFQYGGLGALLDHEIDVLVTPDPVQRDGLHYLPVFDYELMLVTPPGHRLADASHIEPRDLLDEVLVTYPVPVDRLDIFALFMNPAGCLPARHKSAESTEMLLQLVAAGRGLTALPRWLVSRASPELNLSCVRLGESGIHKSIHLGMRASDLDIAYLAGFIERCRDLSAEPRDDATV